MSSAFSWALLLSQLLFRSFLFWKMPEEGGNQQSFLVQAVQMITYQLFFSELSSVGLKSLSDNINNALF